MEAWCARGTGKGQCSLRDHSHERYIGFYRTVKDTISAIQRIGVKYGSTRYDLKTKQWTVVAPPALESMS